MLRIISITLATLTLLTFTNLTAYSKPDATKLQDDADTAFAAKKWKVAVDKLSQANELVPNNPIIETNLGFALTQNGQPEEAITHLLHATRLDPSSDVAWTNLAAAYQAAHKLTEYKEALEQFIKFAKDPEEKATAQSQIKLLEEAIKERVTDNSETDYLQSTLAVGRERWSAERQPVKVYIEDGSAVPNYKPEFLKVLKQSFADWQTASGESVKFTFVSNKDDAAIDVSWVNDQSQMENPAEAGLCKTIIDGQGLKSARILIGLFKVEYSEPTPESVRATCLHEVGHACGLQGHSQNPADIMYLDVAKSTSVLSARDKETIRKFYSDDIGESWLAVNDAGVAAMKKSEFELALKNFAKAMAMTDDQTVKNNCAAAHFNWAQALLNAGDTKAAEDHYKSAFELQQHAKDGKNYSLIVDGYIQFLREQKRNAEADAIEKQAKN